MSEAVVMADGMDEQDKSDPRASAARWADEFTAAKKSVQKWHKDAKEVVRRFLDQRDEKSTGHRLNLFHANVHTLRCLLYGKTPQVDVERRFADADDDVARLAGELLQRLLNADIERDSDCYAQALQDALSDYLLPGIAVVRVRYEREEGEPETTPAIMGEDGTEKAPAVVKPTIEREDVATDYVHWEDFLWSPARTWGEVRWVAFRAKMGRRALKRRFGKVGALVPLNSERDQSSTEAGKDHPWDRADVWEIWDKEDRKVFWYVEGYPETLDEQADPLGLEGFYPCPRPMVANVTTSAFMPRPDFILAQDLYNEIDSLSARIDALEHVIRATGAYNQSERVLERLVEGGENKLYPAENWDALKEGGGLKGAVDWLPIDIFAAALDKLEAQRASKIALLYQITGMSDIMRGQAQAGATATEQAIKAKFASVRVQSQQDEFARFASDTQRLKAEIISKLFAPETIIERSNAQFMPKTDQQLIGNAVALIKSQFYAYRVQVKPEAVSLTDYAALKQERTEVIAAISGYLQAVQPLGMATPALAPHLLQILQWMVAGVRGGSGIESVLDQAVQMAEQLAAQPPQPPPPDPKLEAAKVKAGAEQFKAQADMQKTGMDMQVARQKAAMEQAKLGMDMQLEQLRIQREMAKAAQPQPTQGGAP